MEEPDALSLLSCKWCIKFAYQQIYMAYSNHAQNLLKSSAFQVQVPDQPRKGQQLQQVEVAMAPLLPWTFFSAKQRWGCCISQAYAQAATVARSWRPASFTGNSKRICSASNQAALYKYLVVYLDSDDVGDNVTSCLGDGYIVSGAAASKHKA